MRYFATSLILHLSLVTAFIWSTSALLPLDIVRTPGTITVEILQTELNSPPAKPTPKTTARTQVHLKQKKAQHASQVAASSIREPDPAIERLDTRIGHADLSLNPSNQTPTTQQKYLLQLRQRLQQEQRYPNISRKLGERGLVKLQLTIHRDGHLEHLEVLDPSPYPRLREAAEKSVARVFPFAEFPSDIPYSSWMITVPIRFEAL